MNFQSIGRSSNFATAGNAAADDTLKSFLAARRNSPNYGKLAENAASYKSAEKVATIKAEAAVEQAGIKAKAKVKADKIEIDAKSNYANAKRKAGALAVAGKMFGSIGTAGGDKPLEPYKGTSREKLQGEIDTFNSEAEEIRAGITKPTKPDFSSTPTSTGGGSTSTNSGGGSPITPSGGTVDRGEVYTYLTKDKGLSHNKAYGLMSNIDRESGFVANIRSGDDQGPGGLFQWKGVRQTPTVAKLVNSGDWKGQIDYALTEPGESASSTFLNTTWNSPQEAAAYWTRAWERPAHPDADVVKNNNFIAGYTYHQ